MHEFKWVGEPRPEYEAQLLKELDDLFEYGLDCPGDLITHTVFLDKDHEHGAALSVWGRDGEDTFYVEYIPKIEWVDMKGLETPGPKRKWTKLKNSRDT